MTAEEKIIAAAQEAIQIEIEGLNAIKTQIGTDFVRLVNACMETLEKNGKIVITGVGKSGHIGKKMAATLASTGSTSIFMHPVEAMHGDLGMLQENDIMLALSYSGETQELTRMIVPAKRLGVPVACFTGVADSTLAKLSDIAVIASVEREACPFNLAPTTTSTAHLALGDALAMVLLQCRKFTKEDMFFADEILVTSTTKLCKTASHIDNCQIGGKDPKKAKLLCDFLYSEFEKNCKI